MAKRSKTTIGAQLVQTVESAARPPQTALKSRTNSYRPSLVLATLASAWCVVALLELAPNLVISGSAVNNGQIPLGARFGLVSYDIVVLSAFLFIFFSSLRLLTRRFRRR